MILFQVRLGCSGTFFRSTPKSLQNSGLRRGAEQDGVVNNSALQEETTSAGASNNNMAGATTTNRDRILSGDGDSGATGQALDNLKHRRIETGRNFRTDKRFEPMIGK
jgi:hypothetical protein